ncbi:hypothetical protein RhiJN_10586 [Ceratobasidium sp. AG-Ba]|nr:hypothetical protein RhiJN_10586 [Ceratobasidium sp. AG-Ba]QRW11323.1 hypothetical protein RhiLY_10322 [Ceratobasidium sp. AG-Ba]
MTYLSTVQSRPPAKEAPTKGHLRSHQLRETLLRPRQTVPGSLEPSGEVFRTASRLLDPSERCNRDVEHLKTIELIKATDQLAKHYTANPGHTTDEPKHSTPNQRLPNSSDKPRHARFVDVRNGNTYDLPTPVITEFHGPSSYGGSDNGGRVPWLPPAADLAHLSFDERLEVLRIHHDRCRRYALDSESALPYYERVMFNTAWKKGQRRADLHDKPMKCKEDRAASSKLSEPERRRGHNSQSRPSCPVDTGRTGLRAQSRQVQLTAASKGLPPPGLVRKYANRFEEYASSSTCSNSSKSSSNTSFGFSNTPSSSNTSTSSANSPMSFKPSLPFDAPSLETRIEYYREASAGPPVTREGATGSWFNDMLRARLHRRLGFEQCIDAGIEPEMAALVAVSLDKAMLPTGVQERYSAVKKWEDGVAREQEHKADVGWELEKEQALKGERQAVRMRIRERGLKHGCKPRMEPSQFYGGQPRVDGLPNDPHRADMVPPPALVDHVFKSPEYQTRATATHLKRSGAICTSRRPPRTCPSSPMVLKAGV